MKRNFKFLIIQLCAITAIVFILFFSLSWIILHIQSPQNSFKEAMGLTLSFLGPISTIFASIIAVYLFNDWKDQHNKEVQNEFALNVYNQFGLFEKAIFHAETTINELEFLATQQPQPGPKAFTFINLINSGDRTLNKNRKQHNEFQNELTILQNEFNYLLDKYRYYCIVTNQITEARNITIFLCSLLSNIDDENKTRDECNDYKDIIALKSETMLGYKNLRDTVFDLIIFDILKTLQV